MAAVRRQGNSQPKSQPVKMSNRESSQFRIDSMSYCNMSIEVAILQGNVDSITAELTNLRSEKTNLQEAIQVGTAARTSSGEWA